MNEYLIQVASNPGTRMCIAALSRDEAVAIFMLAQGSPDRLELDVSELEWNLVQATRSEKWDVVVL